MKQSARASEQERRERQAARAKTVRGAGARLGLVRSATHPSSSMATRRRRQHQATLLILLVLVALTFVVRPDWPARLAVLVVAVLAYPVLRTLLFRRT